jgi:hypothetical protein
VPAGADDGAVAGLIAELLEVLATSGLVRARAPLKTEAAVLEELADRSPSVVTVRNERGEVVDVEADDAGALLRRIEGPGLDIAYARRFADRIAVVADGCLVADGEPAAVLQPGLLDRVFRISAIVETRDGQPLIVPWIGLVDD